MEETKKTRKKRTEIDRKSNQYSAEAFLKLPHSKKLELAEKYLLGTKAAFDDSRLYQFSFDSFVRYLEADGIAKVQKIEDKMVETPYHTVFLSRKNKPETTRKALTLEKQTAELFDQIFDDNSDFSSQEQARIISKLLDEWLRKLIEEKSEGKLAVCMEPVNNPFVVL